MDKASLYYRSHVVAAAVWLLNHKRGAPPTVADVARETGFPLEEAQVLVNGMKKTGVLSVVESGAEDRLFVSDPAPMEELPKKRTGANMEKDLERFAAQKAEEMKKIESLAKGEGQRKKDLFEAINRQLKENMKKGQS